MHSWSLPFSLQWLRLLLLYLRGWRQIHLAFPGALRPWRPVAFVVGMLVLLAVTGSPLAMLDHHYLTAHMAQHLLLMTLAVPLILAGAPAITLLQVFPPAVSGLFHRHSVQRFTRVLTHPVFCWLACTAVVIGWHVPADVRNRNALGVRHAVEHFCFFAAGILFWWPVVQPWPAVARWPSWSIPVYLFWPLYPATRCRPSSVCAIEWSISIICPLNRRSHIAALKDQACAGALMWVWVTFAYLFPAAALTFRLLSPEKRFVEKQVVRYDK